tara:strand:- start:281 stop:571 length:291 start_codon:yes stop_codon:yes gene_type:complete
MPKKGYWVVRARISNFDSYSKYIELATKIISKYNGTFLIRGGAQEEFEESGLERTVVVEFESHTDAIECYKSEDYQVALEHVKDSATRYVSIVEGV